MQGLIQRINITHVNSLISSHPSSMTWNSVFWKGFVDLQTNLFPSFFFKFICISWRLITLQHCSGFCHTLTWISHELWSSFWSPLPPPSPSHPSGSSHCTSPEHLSHASNLGWWSVSPLIVYLFQYYSLRTSHPCLLPQRPEVCSVHLCLFFCFEYRVIVIIF